jgi:hypothetical protein
MNSKYYKPNLLKTKVYTPGNKDILDIGLDNIGSKYIQLMLATKLAREEERKVLREQLEYEYILEYNKTHEDSYEGDFEFLERTIDARMGNHCNLGSEQKEEFKAYLEDFAKSVGIFGTAHLWMFPQMLKYVADKVPIRRNDLGNISARKMLNSDKTFIGILAIFMATDRSIFIKKQSERESAPYGKLTPLFMYAYKLYKNIPYSEWEREEVEFVVEKDLANAMVTELPELSKEELFKYKKEALMVKSGDKQGQSRSSVTTFLMYPTGGSPLYPLNSLSRAMLCQTWLAHPDNRMDMMILDPDDWDYMPDTLVQNKVIKEPSVQMEVPEGAFWAEAA